MIVFIERRVGRSRKRSMEFECSACGADPIDVPHPRHVTLQVCPNGCVTVEEAAEDMDILLAKLRGTVV